MEKIKKIFIVSTDKNLKEVLSFCFEGWGYKVFLHDPPLSDITPIKKISPSVIVVDVRSARKSQLAICDILKDDFNTSFIPVITLINKRQLRSQLLSLKYGVDDYLVKPPDPLDLRIRVEMAIRRAHYGFYASSLTRLPGGRIIEETLKDRIKKNRPFSFGYVDLDNFKYFNDVYGYQNGDRIIMQTAHMLYTTVKKFGDKDDFVGHIGGDDFVYITTSERYEVICQNFISMFDKIVPFQYSKEDRRQGYMIAKDRSHHLRKIPLMSVSVAVVSKSNPSELKSLVEINEKVTEIKHYLKDIPGSKFMADRRSNGGNVPVVEPMVYKKNESFLSSYMPLGQILLDRNVISVEQLEEGLRTHWEKGIILGETLLDLGFLKEKELKEALSAQGSFVPKLTKDSNN